MDVEGNRFLLLKEIVHHEKDSSALSQTSSTVDNTSGSQNPTRKYTTKGWHFCCLWANGSTSWEPMHNLKDSNPIELAEYAYSHKLLDEPTFAWWAKEALCQCKRMISKVKSRYWQCTHQFGIHLPKTVSEALELDK